MEIHTEVAGYDTRKQDPGSTQRDASNLDFSQQSTDGNHHCQNKYRVCNALSKNELFDKFHTPNSRNAGQR